MCSPTPDDPWIGFPWLTLVLGSGTLAIADEPGLNSTSLAARVLARRGRCRVQQADQRSAAWREARHQPQLRQSGLGLHRGAGPRQDAGGRRRSARRWRLGGEAGSRPSDPPRRVTHELVRSGPGRHLGSPQSMGTTTKPCSLRAAPLPVNSPTWPTRFSNRRWTSWSWFSTTSRLVRMPAKVAAAVTRLLDLVSSGLQPRRGQPLGSGSSICDSSPKCAGISFLCGPRCTQGGPTCCLG